MDDDKPMSYDEVMKGILKHTLGDRYDEDALASFDKVVFSNRCGDWADRQAAAEMWFDTYNLKSYEEVWDKEWDALLDEVDDDGIGSDFDRQTRGYH